MFKPLDLAARSLLIIGGLNWLSMGADRFDLVAWATGDRKRPNIAARTIYGIVGGAALFSLARLIEQSAFPKGPARVRGAVREVMTSNPESVGPHTTIAEAARVMQRGDVGSLPVVQDGRLVGILTDRDIALRVAAEGKDASTLTAGEVASQELVTVESGESLDEALRLMARRQLRRLPVVDEGRVVGMLAQADLARKLGDAEAGAVVEQISR
jgi:CBS domain-containing protein